VEGERVEGGRDGGTENNFGVLEIDCGRAPWQREGGKEGERRRKREPYECRAETPFFCIMYVMYVCVCVEVTKW
jgi:hypothetical protein